jgi:hypothetical protein
MVDEIGEDPLGRGGGGGGEGVSVRVEEDEMEAGESIRCDEEDEFEIGLVLLFSLPVELRNFFAGRIGPTGLLLSKDDNKGEGLTLPDPLLFVIEEGNADDTTIDDLLRGRLVGVSMVLLLGVNNTDDEVLVGAEVGVDTPSV